jgi:dephospho-CoA kinase
MQRVVIAGGIGAGKSSVLSHLASRGFATIDADDIAREVVAPGTSGLAAIVDAFGPGVLSGETLDRAFLARVVFENPANLARLNRITHPRIGTEIRRRMDSLSSPAVFVAIPLFRPAHRTELALTEVWAVLSTPETALQRLVSGRGFTPDEARARLDAQETNEQRLAIVDVALWNEGTEAALHETVDRLLEERGL